MIEGHYGEKWLFQDWIWCMVLKPIMRENLYVLNIFTALVRLMKNKQTTTVAMCLSVFKEKGDFKVC